MMPSGIAEDDADSDCAHRGLSGDGSRALSTREAECFGPLAVELAPRARGYLNKLGATCAKVKVVSGFDTQVSDEAVGVNWPV